MFRGYFRLEVQEFWVSCNESFPHKPLVGEQIMLDDNELTVENITNMPVNHAQNHDAVVDVVPANEGVAECIAQTLREAAPSETPWSEID